MTGVHWSWRTGRWIAGVHCDWNVDTLVTLSGVLGVSNGGHGVRLWVGAQGLWGWSCSTLLVSFVLQLQFRLSIADLCGINGFANSGCCMVKEYIARGKIRICVEYRKVAIFGDFWKRSAAKIENIAHLLIFTINSEYSSDSLGDFRGGEANVTKIKN